MSLAPNYDVPEDVSPYVFLPILELCTRCTVPMLPLEVRNVLVGDHYVEGVCSWCSDIIQNAWAA